MRGCGGVAWAGGVKKATTVEPPGDCARYEPILPLLLSSGTNESSRCHWPRKLQKELLEEAECVSACVGG